MNRGIRYPRWPPIPPTTTSRFLENDEGNWGESPAQNHTLDVGVGRLPVKTVEEAKDVVDKIIYYDTHKKSYGPLAEGHRFCWG